MSRPADTLLCVGTFPNRMLRHSEQHVLFEYLLRTFDGAVQKLQQAVRWNIRCSVRQIVFDRVVREAGLN